MTTQLEKLYEQIGRQYVLNYVAIGSGIGKLKPKNCTKGWSCGYTCLPKTKKNCKAPMGGQAKTYADWLTKQAPKTSEAKASTSKSKADSKRRSAQDFDSIISDLANQKISTGEALSLAKDLGKDKEVRNFITNSTKADIDAIKAGKTLKQIESDRRKKADSDSKKPAGKPIKTKEEFKGEVEKIWGDLEKEFDLIPIVAIRDSLGSRIGKDEFDKKIKELQDEGYSIVGGEAPSSKKYSSRDIIEGGIETALGGRRFYIKKS